MAVMGVLLLAIAGATGTNMKAMGGAERTARAAEFLDSTLESVAAQPFGNLLVLNGDRYFDEANAAASNYAVDLDVFPAAVGVVQLRATVTDLRTGRELGRVSTLRSQR